MKQRIQVKPFTARRTSAVASTAFCLGLSWTGGQEPHPRTAEVAEVPSESGAYYFSPRYTAHLDFGGRSSH